MIIMEVLEYQPVPQDVQNVNTFILKNVFLVIMLKIEMPLLIVNVKQENKMNLLFQILIKFNLNV